MSPSIDISQFDGYLSPTACRFLQQRGTQTPLTESAIAACCSNGAADGIKLSPTQAEVLRVFGGLRYRPGTNPDFYSPIFEDWNFPDYPYQRGIVAENGEWLVGSCYNTGTFGEEGLWMAPDGSLGDCCWIDRLVVHESLAKVIECHAVIWAAGHPHVGVAWIRAGVPVDEFQALIPGEVVDGASDDLNCVFLSRDSVCIWYGWEPAFERKNAYVPRRVRGTRLDICSSSTTGFDQIVKSLQAADVLDSSARSTQKQGKM